MENVDGVHLLARADKLDGLVNNRADRQGGTAASIAVEFGQHYAREVEAFVECLGGVDGILAGHRVDHKQDFLRIQRSFQILYFLHHGLVDGKAARRVDNDHVMMVGLGICHTVERYLDGVHIAFFAVDRHIDLAAHDLELLYGCRAVDVACYQQRALGLFALVLPGKFARESCFTRALQATHQHDCRVAAEVKLCGCAAHERRELVVYNFHHLLLWLNGLKHILADGLSLDGVGKLLGYLIIDVGVEQCAANVAHGFGNVDFRDFALAFEYLETAFKSFA